jgi:hypothetical protein
MGRVEWKKIEWGISRQDCPLKAQVVYMCMNVAYFNPTHTLQCMIN